MVSSGPPGAGKTDAVELLSLSGFRLIDPGLAKDMLLDEAGRHGLLEYRGDLMFPDGEPLGLRELAADVHPFLRRVTDVVRHLALSAGENVIIDGTLSWPPLADVYINELFAAGYEGLEVVDVETPLALALARTRERSTYGQRSVPLVTGIYS